MSNQPLDPEAIRARLAGKQGPEYWRTLDELAQTEEFKEHLFNEFPPLASEWPEGLDRRNFMKLMAASIALAGVTSGCFSGPQEKILPYVKAPENVVPGKPLFYASAVPVNGYGMPVLVESHMGRPTKIEGNPEHPASGGATDPFTQASILSMYDPDRSQNVVNRGRISTWGEFSAAMTSEMARQQISQGAGFRILTPTVTSPTLAAQINALLKQYPQARWHQYEPVTRDSRREGAVAAFGEPVESVYRFDAADVVLSLDADFLSDDAGSVRYSRDFMNRRRVSGSDSTMNRLYAVESTPTLAGGVADHRLPVLPSQIEPFVRALAARLGAGGGEAVLPEGIPAEWFEAVAADLQQHRGRSLVVPGDYTSPAVHALAHAINGALGNAGTTVLYIPPVEASPVNQMASLRELADDMAAGRVDLLVILGANPVYSAPVDIDFDALLRPNRETGEKKVRLVVHHGLYQDETAYLSDWHVNGAHFLEAWGDVRAFDGTVSIIQPLIAPLYEGRSALEVLAQLQGQAGATPYDMVRNFWKGQVDAVDFEAFWAQTVHDGFMQNTAFEPRPVIARGEIPPPAPARPAGAEGELEIVFRPDPTVWDGEFANNAWLQELPKPFTKVTWDNIFAVSPGTATQLGMIDPQATRKDFWRGTKIAELQYGGRTIRGPVWVLPGQPDGVTTVYLGYGRSRGGNVMVTDKNLPRGYNANAIRISRTPWFDGGATLTVTKEDYDIATTQPHNRIPENRHIMRSATLAEFQQNPEFVLQYEHDPDHRPSLYPEWEYKGYRWAMVIDQTVCTGCSACVVACMAENNIPVVGKEQVLNGREMHWLRIDTYYKGDAANPQTYYQPMLCQHCEKAPCEPVCPVGATIHGSEGLNEMAYNRCVGTRYCANNCPYKVRRFNFLEYTNQTNGQYTYVKSEVPIPESMRAVRNPDVTVRARGVMEKCSYCVQRINHARIEAKKANRRIRDGEVITACQQACPTGAIVFGDWNDKEAAVTKYRSLPHNYQVLGDLNTQPRTTYLARLRNPNPALEPVAAAVETEVHS